MSTPGEAPGPSPRLSRLGRYELITQIGQGGMAEVQLAIQRGPAGFEKLVVVKLVHDHLASQKAFVDMLLDEARVAAMVKHPNVVDIYDLGQAEGRFFIAMEYLEGEPLLAVLRAGREGKRLDVMSTARLIADTAEGLDAAHELRTLAGDPLELVHHDVSLGNIVILYNGQVKLVDFGVAKASQSAGPQVRVQGKFAYMAPEKLKGAAGDRRSDIWSLGCVFWEALTLRRLFKGGNDSDTARQVLEMKLVAPSTVNREVPQEFDPLVMKALDRDPAKRYATAKEMAAAIEEVLRQAKYGGKNDLIAKYMQATFSSHIGARKKLLQEVSSKGKASDAVLTAAFTEPRTRSSPMTLSPGEFSVRIRRESGEMLTNEEASLRRPRSSTAMPAIAPGDIPPATGTVLPDVPPGTGTAALPRKVDRRYIVAAAAGFVLVMILLAAAFGGGSSDAPTANAKVGSAAPPGGTTGSAKSVPTEEPAVVPDAAEPAGSAASTGGSDAGSAAPPAPDPKQAAELFRTGMQAYVKGDAKSAIVSFRRALQADPAFADAWRTLGLAHEKLGEWGQAKTALQKYLELSPDAPDAAQIRERIGAL